MRPVIGAVIYNEQLLPVFIRQQTQNTHNSDAGGSSLRQLVSWRFQQFISHILLELLPVSLTMPRKKSCCF